MSLRVGFEEAVGFLHLSQVRKCELMTRVLWRRPVCRHNQAARQRQKGLRFANAYPRKAFGVVGLCEQWYPESPFCRRVRPEASDLIMESPNETDPHSDACKYCFGRADHFACAGGRNNLARRQRRGDAKRCPGLECQAYNPRAACLQ